MSNAGYPNAVVKARLLDIAKDGKANVVYALVLEDLGRKFTRVSLISFVSGEPHRYQAHRFQEPNLADVDYHVDFAVTSDLLSYTAFAGGFSNLIRSARHANGPGTVVLERLDVADFGLQTVDGLLYVLEKTIEVNFPVMQLVRLNTQEFDRQLELPLNLHRLNGYITRLRQNVRSLGTATTTGRVRTRIISRHYVTSLIRAIDAYNTASSRPAPNTHDILMWANRVKDAARAMLGSTGIN